MEAYFVCGAAAKVSPCHSTFLFFLSCFGGSGVGWRIAQQQQAR